GAFFSVQRSKLRRSTVAPAGARSIIVGSGLAGLWTAWRLALEGRPSVLLTKGTLADSASAWAQGGIAAAVGPGDSPALHAADTLAAGDGLCDGRAVTVLCEDGPRYVRELMEWGAAFDRGPDGQPALGLEAAHSERRVLHVRDATGRSIGGALWDRVAPMPNVRVLDHTRAIALLVEHGRCLGVRYEDSEGVQ